MNPNEIMISLPGNMKKNFKSHCAKRGFAMSELVRRLIIEYMEAQNEKKN